MRRILWSIVSAALLVPLAACGAITPAAPAATSTPATQTAELQVFAAASLTDAFSEIGKGFELANLGAKVTFNFAGSQQLAQQISQGAPADVFASANQKQIDIPDNLNTIASYPIAPLKGAKNASLAQKFVDYVLAPAAQAVLAKYGFIPI
jgi:molybdate transport system substrate-binding protein